MNKPFKTVAIIGVPGSGKTSLLSALTRALAARGKAEFQSVEALTKEANEDPRHLTFALVESPAGRLEFIDAGGGGGTAAELEALSQADVALVVHRAPWEDLGGLTGRLQAARQLQVPWTCAFLLDPDQRAPDTVEGADATVHATAVGDEVAFESLFAALAAGARPTLDVEGPFLLRISSVTSQRGVSVLTGLCARGRIHVGTEVELPGRGTFLVSGVTCYGKMMDKGHAGQELGLVLRGLKLQGDEAGGVVLAPGSEPLRAEATLELLGASHPPLPTPAWLCTRSGSVALQRVEQEGARVKAAWASPTPLAAGTDCVLHDGTRLWPARAE